jgi:hypothetical protein
MLKPAKLRPFQVGYGDQMIAFYPQMASDAQLDEVNQKLLDISDSDEKQYDKIYEIRLEAVAEFSSISPKLITKVKGETVLVDLVEGVDNPLEVMKTFFAVRSNESEKLIRYVYNAYLSQFTPEISFL